MSFALRSDSTSSSFSSEAICSPRALRVPSMAASISSYAQQNTDAG